MTNMFKKTLVAAAIAGMSSSAIAADIKYGGQTVGTTAFVEGVYSSEWIATQVAADSDVTLEDVTITTGAAYNENDLIRVTVTGADLITSTPRLGTAPGTTEEASFISRDGDTLIFRVTESTGIPSGTDLILDTVVVDSSSMSGDISLAYAAQVSGTDLPLDNQGNDEGTVFTVASQFEYEVTTAFEEKIDVGADRLTFEAGAAAETATVTVTDNGQAAPFVQGVAAPEVIHTISGDFTKFTDADGEQLAVGDFVSTTATDATAGPDGFTLAEDGSSVSFSTSDLVFPVTLTTANVDGAISVQDFSVESNLVVDAEASPLESHVSYEDNLGSWTLNGSTVDVSYMPYRSDITQVINVTNRSGQDGDISVVATAEDGTEYDLGVIAESKKGSLTRIAGDIIDGLNQATGVDHSEVGSTTRYSFQIITNAPEASVEVYSAYNVQGTGARLVVNDSNGGAVSKQ